MSANVNPRVYVYFFRVYGCNADFKLRAGASDLITERRATIPVPRKKSRPRVKLQCYVSNIRRALKSPLASLINATMVNNNEIDRTLVYRLTVIYAKRTHRERRAGLCVAKFNQTFGIPWGYTSCAVSNFIACVGYNAAFSRLFRFRASYSFAHTKSIALNALVGLVRACECIN